MNKVEQIRGWRLPQCKVTFCIEQPKREKPLPYTSNATHTNEKGISTVGRQQANQKVDDVRVGLKNLFCHKNVVTDVSKTNDIDVPKRQLRVISVSIGVLCETCWHQLLRRTLLTSKRACAKRMGLCVLGHAPHSTPR